MTRHKMSLSADYVSDWGVQEALRELFQNCIDHGKWEHAIGAESLTLKSFDTCLEHKTLLLGHSKKAEGSIGKFGEGYKLAALVLTRLGYRLTIDTAKELWRPKLIKSRTYKTQQLVFDTVEALVDQTDLTFTVEGLRPEDIEELRRQNLHVTPTPVKLATDKGYVIDRPGDIFVNGLFVCHIDGYRFGYNLYPKDISIDRDRRIVRDFDLKWTTGQMWRECKDHELVLSLIKDKCPEVEYLDSFLYNVDQGLADTAAKAFVTEHGEDAVPVTSQLELEKAQEQGHEKIVLVPKIESNLIGKSSCYSPPPPRIVKRTPREELLDFERTYGDKMYDDMASAFEGLLQKSERWYS